MSATKTYLVLIFSDWNPNWREELLIFDEEHAVMIVADAGIAAFPSKRERRLFFELSQPLKASQIAMLEEHRHAGLFQAFCVCTETISDDGSSKQVMTETPTLKEYWRMR